VEFENPVGRLFGTFSYNNMVVGSQWSALWYWEGELVHYITRPWENGTGGYGYVDWDPPSDQWRSGLYEVQLFVGTDWKMSGYFTVIGDPPMPTVTDTPTQTRTPTQTSPPTQTSTPSRTPTFTPTLTPSQTRWPTASRTVTPTPSQSP